MVVYLDIIILLNFFMDYLILLATSKALNVPYKAWRLVIASLFGVLYIIVFFIPPLSFLTTFFFKVIVSVLMILIAYNYNNLILFLRLIAVFYFISFILGGGVLAIQYLFDIKHEVVNGILLSKSTNPLLIILIIILAAVAIWFFSKNTLKSLNRKASIDNEIVDLQLFINDFSYSCKGLVDTGNRLYDPISRKPVMVVEAKSIPFIPAIFEQAHANGKFQLDLFNDISQQIEADWISKVQLIPFRSVSSKMQFIVTLRPDKVVIKLNDDNELCQTKVLIGLDYGLLSSDRSYQAIVHPELVGM